MTEVDVSIRWPFKWTLAGSSGSGKTNFSLNIVKNSKRLFDQSPTRVIIIYKVFQEIYNSFSKVLPTSYFTEDEVNLEDLTETNKERLLFICDDLYFSKKLNEIAEHFLIKGRHRNTSWIVLTQSLFNQPALKNISRNSTHLTMFKNVRLSEPHILFSQIRPKSSKVLQEIYSLATKEPFGYLDIDLSQTCPDNMRYKTDIFNTIVTVYCIMNNNSFKTMYLVDKKELKHNPDDKMRALVDNDVQSNVPKGENELKNEQLADEISSPVTISDKENPPPQDPVTSGNFGSNEDNQKNYIDKNDQIIKFSPLKDKTLKKPTKKIPNEKASEDAWLSSNQSFVDDKRNNDISKSLITPSDFDFLKSSPPSKYLKKWKPLKEMRKKKVLRGRFKQW